MQNNQLLLFSEQDYYHSSDRCGFFALCHKQDKGNLVQRSYRLDLMPDVIRAVDPTRDTYLSQAEFVRPNRRVVNLKQVGLAFLDLDIYRSVYQHHAPEQACGLLIDYCRDNNIPIPSAVLCSGRGLYAKWFLSSPLPPQALPRWLAVQRHLADSLRGFGADKGALDASRILRLQGTVNTKNGQICRVLWPLATEPCRYDFEALAADVLPIQRDVLRQKKKSQLQAVRGGNKNGLRGFSPLRLWWDRLADVRKLAQIRGGVKEGQRDLFLFVASCALSWCVTPGQLSREVEVLAREFCPGMSRTESWSATGSVRRRAEAAAKGEKVNFGGNLVDSRYKMSNQWLIDALKITQDEITQLKTIIDQDEAAKRDKERSLARRRKAGATSREVYVKKAKNRRDLVAQLLDEGLTKAAIAAELGITKDAAKSLIRQVKKGGGQVRPYVYGG